jgi:hypothetical protein
MVPSECRAAYQQALLSFRYIDGICLRISPSARRLGVEREKVMAGGTPANPATPDGGSSTWELRASKHV